jgi:hypothetical protein
MDDKAAFSKRRWFRFSLRTLLLMVSISALGAWWLARPTVVAYQFARMFRAGNYEEANQLIFDSHSDQVYVNHFAKKKQLKASNVYIVPISWSQVIGGQRILHAELLSEEHGITTDWAVKLEATSQGIRAP